MPGFDGTGPSGQGPMTGRGRGFCISKVFEEKPLEVRGFVGLQGTSVGRLVKSVENLEKEVVDMPLGDGTGPAGLGPRTGRGAGFPVLGNAKPVAGKTALYGSGMPYGGRVTRWFRRAFGFGRGFGRGRGRGRGLGRGRGRFVYWL